MPGMGPASFLQRMSMAGGNVNPMLLAAAFGGLAERLDPKGIAGAVGGTVKETAGAMTTAKALGKTGGQRAKGVQSFIDALQDPSNPVTSVKFDEAGNIASVSAAPPVQTPQSELGTLDGPATQVASTTADSATAAFDTAVDTLYKQLYGG